jgi:hypothetical protein
MTIDDNEHLLFIEPTQPASKIFVVDELTEKMKFAFAQARPSSYAFRGWHTCVCGATSDNRDYFLPNGQKTNYLAVHYLEYHRDEIPESELEKVRAL